MTSQELENHYKTFTITFSNFLNEELIPHFIRGYFDGDGTTSVFKRKDNGKVDCCISLMSSIQFCQGAKNFLETKNISMHINHQSGTNEQNAVLRSHSKKEILKFKELVYKNAGLYMQRKYDKFIEYFQEIN